VKQPADTQHRHPNNDDLRRLANLIGADLDHFTRRILQDAVQEATGAYWARRAQTFAHVGNPRCDEISTACANAAAFHRWRRDPDRAPLKAAP
jgi:hypothetical protein